MGLYWPDQRKWAISSNEIDHFLHKHTYIHIHPFTFIVAGRTQSEKTTVVSNMIQHLDRLVAPPIDDVIIFYKEYQSAYGLQG